MRRLFFLLILLALGIAIGLLVTHHPGIIRIDTANYHISLSLWVGVIAMVLGFFVLHLLYRLFFHSLHAPRRLKKYIRMKRARKARRLQDAALAEMIQGRYADAAQRLQKAGKKSPTPALFYLSAAHCWQRCGEYKRAERTVLLGDTSHGDATLVDLSRAMLLLEQGNQKRAYALLKRHQTHPAAALNLLKLALDDHRGEDALQHIEQARPALAEQHYLALYHQTLTQCLQHCTTDTDAKPLQQLWRNHKRVLVQTPTLHACYLSALARCGDAVSAHKQAIKALHKQWDEAYLPVFQKTAFDHLAASLTLAEQWLTQYPNTPSIHALLGHLYLESGRYHKAIDHFKEAYAATKDPAVAYRLGQAHTQLGAVEEGIHWYAQGCLKNQ